MIVGKHLLRICWKTSAGRIAFDEDLVRKLQLTAEQKDQLVLVEERNESEHREMLQGLERIRFKTEKDRESFQEKYKAAARQRLYQVLTAEQINRYEALESYQVMKPPKEMLH